GALGAVASRIGALRADVTAVEIVERRQGSAVDEFVIELPDENHLSLLLSEISEVDGVSVEEVHPISGRVHDRRLDAYDTAVEVLQVRSPPAVLSALAARVCLELDAAWTAVIDVEQELTVASHGRPPAASWLAALVRGARATTAPGSADPDAPASTRPAAAKAGRGAKRVTGSTKAGAPPDPDGETGSAPARPEAADIGWVDLAAWDLVLAAGRPGLRFGRRERSHLAAVARLADARWVDLAEREARASNSG
ncbi:MAG: hypothetical protein ABSG81_15815, partial [Acidimicrobiales bacterium]